MTKPTIASLLGQVATLEANVVMERDLRVRAQGDRKDMENALNKERESHNVTRDVLHSTELELAKTRGYLDAKQDAEPPVMVPLQREGHLASYADGSRSISAGWRNEGYSQTPNKPWWHK